MDLDPSQYSEADRLRRGKVKAPGICTPGAFFSFGRGTRRRYGTGGDGGAARHICGLAQRLSLHAVPWRAQRHPEGIWQSQSTAAATGSIAPATPRRHLRWPTVPYCAP